MAVGDRYTYVLVEADDMDNSVHFIGCPHETLDSVALGGQPRGGTCGLKPAAAAPATNLTPPPTPLHLIHSLTVYPQPS